MDCTLLTTLSCFFGREFFRQGGLHINKRGDKSLKEILFFSMCDLSSPIGGKTSAQTLNDSVIIQCHNIFPC